MLYYSKRTIKAYLFFSLSILLFTSSAIAEKDPKAAKDAAAQIPTETDPLKAELKPGEIFNCEADIFYEWETVATEKVEAKKSKVFFQTLVERGKDGNLTKTRLESRLLTAKNEATLSCKSEHNVPDCTTKKISNAKSELRLLDFQTRRMMTANLIEECENTAGNCLEASSSEMRCQVYRSPDSTPKKEEAAAGNTAPTKK